MSSKIQIIDLFAGPGGLGEGFSAFRNGRHGTPFRIAMSVEKEETAHRTLELRAFYRQFAEVPSAYYKYLRREISRKHLFESFPKQASAARQETLFKPRELGPEGSDDVLIYSRLRELKKEKPGPWVVIGGPPCQAYSLVGRARNRGVQGYRPENDRRHYLYEDYLKVLSIIQPQVFVMENVKGILSSKVRGQYIFSRILSDLRSPGTSGRTSAAKRYRLFSFVSGAELTELDGSGSDCIIRSEEYGVPQSRHRVILLGVREDVAKKTLTLTKANHANCIDGLLKDLPKLRSGLSKQSDSDVAWHEVLHEQAIRIVKSLSKSDIQANTVREAVHAARSTRHRGGAFLNKNRKYRGPVHLQDWLVDTALCGVINHETRGHIASDLGRYLYSACYALQHVGTSPKAHQFPKALWPEHMNWTSGKFVDRFKVQSKHRPSSTITCHIAKDGHYYIHYDPAQCRSLTVREAARLQTFPDNYLFEGNRTQQYVQVGNAVPPWLARQIAEIVYEVIR